MARYNQLQKYSLVPGGVTNNIPLDLISDGFIIDGTQTITANNVFTTTDTPEEGNQLLTIYYKGVATYSGGVVQIFGTNLTQDEAQNRCKIECYFNGVDWDVYVATRYSNTGYVRNPQIAGDAGISLDKFTTVTANRAIQSTAGGQLEASPTTTTDLAKLSAISVSASQINNVGATTSVTNDLNLLAGSALAGLTSAEIQRLIGVTSNIQTQLNAKANSADISGLVEIKSFSVTIPSAQVLMMSSPITLIPAQGAGLKIVPISAQASINFNSIAYATAVELDIYVGGILPCLSFPQNILFVTSSVTFIASNQITSINATDTQIVANAPLTIVAGAGMFNPDTGNSDITISGLYIVTT